MRYRYSPAIGVLGFALGQLRFLASLISLSLVVSCITTRGQTSTTSSEGLQIKVRTSRERYEPGASVGIRIEFFNRGERPIKLGFVLQGETRENLSVLLELLDVTGKKIEPRMEIHLSPFGKHPERDFWLTLDPQHFYGWDVSLTPFMYDCLNKPGIYQIRVLYGYHPPNQEIEKQGLEPGAEGRQQKLSIFTGTLQSEPVRFSIADASS